MIADRTAFVLFCDDVRQEVGNKTSYMGVYPANIAFPPNPPADAQFLLPRLCIAIWITMEISDNLERARIKISSPPGDTPLFNHEIPREQIDIQFSTEGWMTRKILHTVLPFGKIIFPHSGFINVVVETEQGEIQAGRLRVIIPDRPDPNELSNNMGAPAAKSSLPSGRPTPARRRTKTKN